MQRHVWLLSSPDPTGSGLVNSVDPGMEMERENAAKRRSRDRADLAAHGITDSFIERMVSDHLRVLSLRREIVVDRDSSGDELLDRAAWMLLALFRGFDPTEDVDKKALAEAEPDPKAPYAIDYSDSLLKGMSEASDSIVRVILGATWIEHWINHIIVNECANRLGDYFKELLIRKLSTIDKLSRIPAQFEMSPIDEATILTCRKVFEARNFISHYKWTDIPSDRDPHFNFAKLDTDVRSVIADLCRYEDQEYHNGRASELFPGWPLTQFNDLLGVGSARSGHEDHRRV